MASWEEIRKALRAAGGDGWDKIDDPEEFLGRRAPVDEAMRTLIDEIMDEFDFAKVAQHMRATNWQWVRHNSPADPIEYYQPEERDLRRTARRLLTDIAGDENENVLLSSGGFTALRYPGMLKLLFSIADHTAELPDEGGEGDAPGGVENPCP
jgi:hypothetical protein